MHLDLLILTSLLGLTLSTVVTAKVILLRICYAFDVQS